MDLKNVRKHVKLLQISVLPSIISILLKQPGSVEFSEKTPKVFIMVIIIGGIVEKVILNVISEILLLFRKARVAVKRKNAKKEKVTVMFTQTAKAI